MTQLNRPHHRRNNAATAVQRIDVRNALVLPITTDPEDFYDDENKAIALMPETLAELTQLTGDTGLPAVEFCWTTTSAQCTNTGEINIEGIRTVNMNRLYARTGEGEDILDLRIFKPAEWLDAQQRGHPKQVWDEELRTGYEYCLHEILECVARGADAVRVLGDRLVEDYMNVGMAYQEGQYIGKLGIALYPSVEYFYTYDKLANVIIKYKRG